MVSGYTTFVNDGVRVDPVMVTQIEDMHGNIVATFTPKMTEVLTADAAHKMLYMLQNVINGGTGGRLRSSFGLQMPLGGKTGTTQNNSDAWFMGFSPDLVAGSEAKSVVSASVLWHSVKELRQLCLSSVSS